MVGRSALGYSALGYSVLVLGAREERDQEIEKKKWFFKGCLKQTSGFVRQLFNSGFPVHRARLPRCIDVDTETREPSGVVVCDR